MLERWRSHRRDPTGEPPRSPYDYLISTRLEVDSEVTRAGIISRSCYLRGSGTRDSFRTDHPVHNEVGEPIIALNTRNRANQQRTCKKTPVLWKKLVSGVDFDSNCPNDTYCADQEEAFYLGCNVLSGFGQSIEALDYPTRFSDSPLPRHGPMWIQPIGAALNNGYCWLSNDCNAPRSYHEVDFTTVSAVCERMGAHPRSPPFLGSAICEG